MGLSIIAALAITGTWVAFGPGERQFTSSFSGLGVSLSDRTNETFGRVVFGFGTILTWLLFVLIAIKGARQLFWTESPSK